MGELGLVRDGLATQWEGSGGSRDRLGNPVPQSPRGHARQCHVPFASSIVPRRAMTGLLGRSPKVRRAARVLLHWSTGWRQGLEPKPRHAGMRRRAGVRAKWAWREEGCLRSPEGGPVGEDAAK